MRQGLRRATRGSAVRQLYPTVLTGSKVHAQLDALASLHLAGLAVGRLRARRHTQGADAAVALGKVRILVKVFWREKKEKSKEKLSHVMTG